MSTTVITVGSKSVILVDVRNKAPADIDDVRQMLAEAAALIASSPEKSAYVITDLTNSAFDPKLVSVFSDFVKGNTPYVKDSVLVGLSERHKIIASMFRKMYHRHFYLADTLDEARKYLWTAK